MCKNFLLFEEGACFHSFRHQLLFLLWIGHPAGQLLLLRLSVTRVKHYLHYYELIEKKSWLKDNSVDLLSGISSIAHLEGAGHDGLGRRPGWRGHLVQVWHWQGGDRVRLRSWVDFLTEVW